MWKNIILQAAFEIALLMILYLDAPKIIPEDKESIVRAHRILYDCFGERPGKQPFDPNDSMPFILYGTESSWSKEVQIKEDKVDNINCQTYITSGANKAESLLFDAFNYYEIEHGATTHMTLIFNVFVFYTLFNQLNCRIIDDSFNTFARIKRGLSFIIVTLVEMIIQVLIVQLSKNVFHVAEGGLSLRQWGYCLVFSITTILFDFIIKLIPLQYLIDRLISKKKVENSDIHNDIPEQPCNRESQSNVIITSSESELKVNIS